VGGELLGNEVEPDNGRGGLGDLRPRAAVGGQRTRPAHRD
jgi:hypothetical protein